MTAEKWDALTHRQPSQTSLVVATFARAPGMRAGSNSPSTMARYRKPAHVGT